MADAILIRGARTNNLKNISCSIPRKRLVAVTGPSGSGKSSLIFGTVYREARRRFLSTLLPVAEKSLNLSEPRTVDNISGLSFTIGVREENPSAEATVASITELFYYLRLIFFRLGTPHCNNCGERIAFHTRREILDALSGLESKANLAVYAPISFSGASHASVEKMLFEKGFSRVFIAGENRRLDELSLDDLQLSAEVEVFLDLIPQADRLESRVLEAIDLSLDINGGDLRVRVGESLDAIDFSLKRTCTNCGKLGEDLHFEKFTSIGPSLPSAVSSYKYLGRSFGQIFSSTVAELAEYLPEVKRSIEFEAECPSRELGLLREALEELVLRCDTFLALGLGHLGLDRRHESLSTGEFERCILSREIGRRTSGLIYLFDEPTTGLHPSDTKQLLSVLRQLVERGSSVVLIEHDPFVIDSSDYIVELGPGGGVHGGEIVRQGPRSKRRGISVCKRVRLTESAALEHAGRSSGGELLLEGAAVNNLRDIRVSIPLGQLVAITGVSGSGKSSLLYGVLVPALRLLLERERHAESSAKSLELALSERETRELGFRRLFCSQRIDRLSVSEISADLRSVRSTVATFSRVLKPIREFFSKLPEAKIRGYSAKNFSFNLKDGWCPDCRGRGTAEVSMDVYDDIELLCGNCRGLRYKREILGIRYRGASIAEIQNKTVDQLLELFSPVPPIRKVLFAVSEIGLGYLRLSQQISTLSSGERQRLHLLLDMKESSKSHTLYVFDEPSSGLSYSEVQKLLDLLRKLLAAGNSIIFISHDVHCVAMSDYVIDLGPGAGSEGGEIVDRGSPRAIRDNGLARIAEYLA